MTTQTSAMVRTAIFVSNLQRSRAFYEGVLGWREVYIDVDLSDGNAWQLLGQPQRQELPQPRLDRQVLLRRQLSHRLQRPRHLVRLLHPVGSVRN